MWSFSDEAGGGGGESDEREGEGGKEREREGKRQRGRGREGRRGRKREDEGGIGRDREGETEKERGEERITVSSSSVVTRESVCSRGNLLEGKQGRRDQSCEKQKGVPPRVDAVKGV